jgi:hypothetical protein
MRTSDAPLRRRAEAVFLLARTGNRNCHARGTLNRVFNCVDANMRIKRQKPIGSILPPTSENRLWQQMSEVISLRKKLAQAELEARHNGNVAEEGRQGRRRRRANTRSPTSQPASV